MKEIIKKLIFEAYDQGVEDCYYSCVQDTDQEKTTYANSLIKKIPALTEAEQACIDIYDSYLGFEVDRLPSSITNAWYIGRELKRAE